MTVMIFLGLSAQWNAKSNNRSICEVVTALKNKYFDIINPPNLHLEILRVLLPLLPPQVTV